MRWNSFQRKVKLPRRGFKDTVGELRDLDDRRVGNGDTPTL